jgi:hypothetical protein
MGGTLATAFDSVNEFSLNEIIGRDTAFQQATATILDKRNIQIAEAKEGRVYRTPNIPGPPL